ncbi:MAG: hypothetical protein EOP54_01345 [Sphingobacteriales bacterium]|nr:MAG: hypothetical protein EOP54_01345 [Sphingobacteriales bacterium]
MKKYLYLLLSVSLFVTASCKKERSTCYYNIYYLPFGFAFEGFTADEVDTLILKTYAPGSGFSNLQHTDTIYTANNDITDGIIYRKPEADSAHTGSGSGFGALTIGSDYILEFPALQSAIKIKEITQGPDRHIFQVDGRCSPGAGQARFDIFKANFESNYQVVLKKGKIGHPDDNIALVKK